MGLLLHVLMQKATQQRERRREAAEKFLDLDPTGKAALVDAVKEVGVGAVIRLQQPRGVFAHIERRLGFVER